MIYVSGPVPELNTMLEQVYNEEVQDQTNVARVIESSPSGAISKHTLKRSSVST